MSNFLIGVDIGGTKCAVVLGNDKPEILKRISFPTRTNAGPEQALEKILEAVDGFIKAAGSPGVSAVGISCGGPLDSRNGIILSPPNLPGWDGVPVGDILRSRFGLPVILQNDANACALAEWRWGAGKGARNMIFLTFGTGLGAGLILDGKLYSGTNDMAGEVGHVRLESDGPPGYGKKGSFEGFCSGGGIARLAETVLKEWRGNKSDIVDLFAAGTAVTAKDVCTAASDGDPAALEILKISGSHLGIGLSLLIDILNPEKIVIGSVYSRCREHLEPFAMEMIKNEALAYSAGVCSVVPSALGDELGDYASLSVAMEAVSSK